MIEKVRLNSEGEEVEREMVPYTEPENPDYEPQEREGVEIDLHNSEAEKEVFVNEDFQPIDDEPEIEIENEVMEVNLKEQDIIMNEGPGDSDEQEELKGEGVVHTEQIFIAPSQEESLMEEPSELEDNASEKVELLDEDQVEEIEIEQEKQERLVDSEDGQVVEEMIIIQPSREESELEEPSETEEFVEEMVDAVEVRPMAGINEDTEDNVVRMNTEGGVEIIHGVRQTERQETEGLFQEEDDLGFATGFDPRVMEKVKKLIEIDPKDKFEEIELEDEGEVVEVEVDPVQETGDSGNEEAQNEENLDQKSDTFEQEGETQPGEEEMVEEIQLDEDDKPESVQEEEAPQDHLETHEIVASDRPEEPFTDEPKEEPEPEQPEEIELRDEDSSPEVEELEIEGKISPLEEVILVDARINDPNNQITLEMTIQEEPLVKFKRSLKAMVLNEASLEKEEEINQPEVAVLKDSNEPDIRYAPQEEQEVVELPMPAEPRTLLNSDRLVTQDQQTLGEIRDSKEHPEQERQFSEPLPLADQQYMDRVYNHYQQKHEVVEVPQPVQVQTFHAKVEQVPEVRHYSEHPTISSTLHKLSQAIPIAQVNPTRPVQVHVNLSESSQFQRIKERYFPKPLATEVVQESPIAQPVNYTSQPVTHSQPADTNLTYVHQPNTTQMYQNTILVNNESNLVSFAQPIQPVQPQTTNVFASTLHTRKSDPVAPLMQSLQPQIAELEPTFNKKVLPESTVIAHPKTYNTEPVHVQYAHQEEQYKTPKRTSVPKVSNRFSRITSSTKGEILPITSIIKDPSKLTQSIEVRFNPDTQKKRIILTSSSRLVRHSHLNTEDKTTSSFWKSNDHRSQPIKKKPMFSEKRTPVVKHEMLGRQHSVSAKPNHYSWQMNYKREAERHRQHQILDVTGNNTNIGFYSTSVPDNQLILEQVKAPEHKPEASYTATQYTSVQSRPLVESRVEVLRKSSYPSAQNTQPPTENTFLSTQNVQNSLAWTEHTRTTQQAMPTTSKPLSNSFYPNQMVGNQLGGNSVYRANDEYHFQSQGQPAKESIVISKQTNPNLLKRFSEVKSSSFETSTFKSESILF